MRRLATVLGAVLGLALQSVPAGGAPEPVGSGAHPLFDDAGTLRWFMSFAAAARTARAEGRLVFMDMGRRACSPCETLVRRVLPDARVRARLQRVAVGLAVDADRPEAFIDALRRKSLPHETLLPMTAFLTPDGTWITGASGALDVTLFLVHLERAEAALGGRLPPPPPASVPRTPSAPAALPRAPSASQPRTQVPAQSSRTGTQASSYRPTPAAPPAPDAEARISCCVEHNLAWPGPAEAPGRSAPPARVAAALARAQPLPPAPAPRTPLPATVVRAAPPALAPSAPLPVRPPEPRVQPTAERELERGLNEALAGRTASARSCLERVGREFAGSAAARDATRGLEALVAAHDLAQLSDPQGALARALRANKREELQGTRWTRLFPG